MALVAIAAMFERAKSMYSPPAFREDRVDVLHDVIRVHPLGALITVGRSGVIANLLPFSLSCGPNGHILRTHLAKGNDQLDDLREQTPVLVLFQGPHAYVSPSWYPTKQEHGKVVPTWDYVMVQVRGTPTVVEDSDWILAQIEQLTKGQEIKRREPWSVAQAPESFIAALLRGIVGLEVPIERIEGKWKVSQNQPVRNQLGVAAGLRADGQHHLADMVLAAAATR